MSHKLFYFRPNSNQFSRILIDDPNELKIVYAIDDGKNIDLRKTKFTLLENEREGDFPSLDLILPVLSKKAWGALGDLVSPFCRVYQIQVDGEDYFTLSVRHIVDCLDKTASRLQYFKDAPLKNKILTVHELAIVDDRLDDAPIFKIRHIEGKGIFLSEAFWAVVDRFKLKGLDKEQVWPHPRGKRRTSF